MLDPARGMAPLSSALHGRSGQKVLVAVCVSAALLALGLVSLTEDGYSVALEAPGGGIAADAAGIKGLEAQISSAQEHNKALSFGMKKTSASQPPTPCLAGSAGCSPPLNDWSGEYLDHVAANEGVVGGAPGCCDGDADAAPPETAVGDMSIGAVIDQMRRKLSIMKKKFRDVQAKYYKGAPRIIDLKVKPRGPPGYTGMPGVMGEQGVKGEQGALGPIGHKGRTGQQGLQGEQGRQGAKGMVGSIGERRSAPDPPKETRFPASCLERVFPCHTHDSISSQLLSPCLTPPPLHVARHGRGCGRSGEDR